MRRFPCADDELMYRTLRTSPAWSSSLMNSPVRSSCHQCRRVMRKTGPSVMVVVPRSAHGRRCENSDVAALVTTGEFAVADRVAERVHHPRGVVEREDPGKAAPQNSADEPVDRLRHQAADDARDHEAEQHESEVLAVDFHHPTVLQPVTGVSAPVDLLHVEQPTDMAVPQAFYPAPYSRALRLWRVWVAVGVGECVMKPMVRHPEHDGPLRGHRGGDGEEHFDRFRSLERAVGEVPMQARPPRQDAVIRYMTANNTTSDTRTAVVDRVNDGADRTQRGQPDGEVRETRGKDVPLRLLRLHVPARLRNRGCGSCCALLDRIDVDRTQLVRQKHPPGFLPAYFSAGGCRDGALTGDMDMRSDAELRDDAGANRLHHRRVRLRRYVPVSGFGDDAQLFGALVGNRKRNGEAEVGIRANDGALDVLWIDVSAVDDHQIFDSARDEQFTRLAGSRDRRCVGNGPPSSASSASNTWRL